MVVNGWKVKVKVFGNAKLSSDSRDSSGGQGQTDILKAYMTQLGDSVCLHTLTEEALASCCPGLHSKQQQSFLPPQHPPPWKILICATHKNIPRNPEL